MFIKRNRSRQGGREYGSVLLVKGEREKEGRGRGRPVKGEKRRTRVVHRTVANLSRLPEELVEVIERWCRGERAGGGEGRVEEGKQEREAGEGKGLAAPPGLTVDDLVDRLGAIRLLGIGPPGLELWRLPDSFLPAQQQILDILPPLPSSSLSLKKSPLCRLKNPRSGRSPPL